MAGSTVVAIRNYFGSPPRPSCTPLAPVPFLSVNRAQCTRIVLRHGFFGQIVRDPLSCTMLLVLVRGAESFGQLSLLSENSQHKQKHADLLDDLITDGHDPRSRKTNQLLNASCS